MNGGSSSLSKCLCDPICVQRSLLVQYKNLTVGLVV
jgi:hypothetical protein